MKKIIISLAVLASLITMSFVGSNACDGNDFFLQGVKSKMGYYNGDGKQTGTGTSEVTKVYTNGDSTIAVVKSNYTDAKKKDSHDSEMKMACVKGVFVMDLGAMMSSNSQQSGSDVKMVCKGNMVAFNSTYTVGEKLEDINMTMETYSNGNLVSTMNIILSNRKVESFEDLTVPAGTFKSYKISYTSTSTMMIGTMKIPGMKPHNSVMFYSAKAGVVRMEDYKDDKMQSYSELLELTKP